ncbi:tRNA (adenosine(37)-N6)-threonylcarbamoyltransferase complex dimerization subunit type 1 TsaB [Microbacterium gilvum]|uniref:tRNA (Adenosine(37)-N6)-threonylcarbamoyltransferase complex dimerization subunit type 1 TsaB n=1 Tax=Microbacterium gilvum TaxID=1336204 RepID=A0ABP9ACF0_9MICO
MILAVDTSIGTGVAVVAPDGEIRSEAVSENALGHAEVIGTLLERALADAGIRSDAVTHVAAGMGPGPFTGLRIGIAAARAFALGRGIPVFGVVSHDAVAHELGVVFPAGGFAVATDARRKENAISVYGGPSKGLPVRVAGPELRPRDADLSADPLLAALAGADVAAAASFAGADVAAPDPAGARDALARVGAVDPALGDRLVLATRIPIGVLGRVAAIRIARGETPDVDEPLYLRSPDVKAPAPRKKVGS